MPSRNGILFIENYIAGGSDQVISTLIKKLSFARLTVVTNCGNDTRILLQGCVPPHVRVITYRLITVAELSQWGGTINSPIFRFLFRLVAFIIRYPLVCFSILYFYIYFRRIGAEVFVANNGGYPGGFYCRSATLAASLMPKCRVFHVVHGMAEPSRGLNKCFEWIFDSIIDQQARILAVCRAASLRLSSKRAIRQDIDVIYNGIPNIPCPPPRNSSMLRILHVGYFDENKNQRSLIKSVSEMPGPDLTDIEIGFAGIDSGDGSMASCQRFAQELGLSKKIQFYGFVQPICDYYANSDIFVLCSRSEAFPISVLEAMRAGKPIIATDTGGISEQIENGVSGLIVPVDDSMALTESLLLLKRNRALRLRLGIAARKRYETLFTSAIMVAKYSKIFELN
ncbi:glycosyltransferase family 4 protein [Burkholderiales bacterium]|nr:glycosyltransferase family 4 protein [Burkholderiales bacterium]